MSPSLALAIPAYNEAAGIVEFLQAIDQEFRGWEGKLTFVVADDCSTDNTLAVLEAAHPTLTANLRVVAMPTNSGHGPTVVRAYREAISLGVDLTLQVDGDGQFAAEDIRRIAETFSRSDAQALIARRRQRSDPWFRRILTRCLRVFLHRRTGLQVQDPNCPLRLYRSTVLDALLADVPEGALVPNVYLAVLADSRGVVTIEETVEHLERKHGAQGTMWGRRQRRIAIPKRLIKFVWRASRECGAFLRTTDLVSPLVPTNDRTSD